MTIPIQTYVPIGTEYTYCDICNEKKKATILFTSDKCCVSICVLCLDKAVAISRGQKE